MIRQIAIRALLFLVGLPSVEHLTEAQAPTLDYQACGPPSLVPCSYAVGRPGRSRVGSNHGYCVAITQRLSHCVGTARLMGGTIEYSANLTGRRPISVSPSTVARAR
jgi:hypothetical protein